MNRYSAFALAYVAAFLSIAIFVSTSLGIREVMQSSTGYEPDRRGLFGWLQYGDAKRSEMMEGYPAYIYRVKPGPLAMEGLVCSVFGTTLALALWTLGAKFRRRTNHHIRRSEQVVASNPNQP